jgi:hypothetical protein
VQQKGQRIKVVVSHSAVFFPFFSTDSEFQIKKIHALRMQAKKKKIKMRLGLLSWWCAFL